MRMVRRIAFAAPLVMVVACQRPAPQRPESEDDEDEEEPSSTQASAATVDAAVPDAAEPDAWVAPSALVHQLPRLAPELTERERERRFLEDCRSGVHTCNPPPPDYRPPPPDVPKPRVVKVELMQREGTGTRVRVKRFWQLNSKWTGVFLDAQRTPVAGGECTFGIPGETEIDCTTTLSVEQLTDRGRVLDLRVEPSAELIARIERERANYIPGGGQVGRIIAVAIYEGGVHLTVSVGANKGVEASWTGLLFGAGGTPIRGGECSIVRVTSTVTLCRAAVTPDQARVASGVRFTPAARR